MNSESTASSTLRSAKTPMPATRRRSPTVSARSCGSIGTAQFRRTTRFSARPPAPIARSGRWAYLIRSRFGWSRDDPDLINESDSGWEEIDDVVAGADFGWPEWKAPT